MKDQVKFQTYWNASFQSKYLPVHFHFCLEVVSVLLTDGLCPAVLETCHKLGMRTVISVETSVVLSIEEYF